MKKLLMVAIAALLAGCTLDVEKDGTTKERYGLVSVEIRTVRGHDYMMAVHYNGGVCALHAASCPCMAQKMYSIEELMTTNRILHIGDYIIGAK